MPSDPMQELIEAAKGFAIYTIDGEPELVHLSVGGFKAHVRSDSSMAAALLRLDALFRSALSNAETHPALKAAGGWRPIESAPKDGTKFLAAWKSGAIGIVWCHRRRNFTGGTSDRCGSPDLFSADWFSHWMPLPPAPGSLALGAVPEGREENTRSQTSPSAASGRPDSPHSAGWVLVPGDPTLDMAHAAADASYADPRWPEYSPQQKARIQYRAMLAAAPSSEAQSPQSEAEPSAGNSGLDEPLPPALPYSAASRP